MLASEILEKTKIGDKIFVIKPIEINWKNIRFSNTSITYAEYIISTSVDVGFWSNNSNVLKCIQTNEGTKNYPDIITSNNTLYQCFFTAKDAEVYKVLELQTLEDKVLAYIEQLKEKTAKKLKKLKHQEKLEDYILKYPESFIKVM